MRIIVLYNRIIVIHLVQSVSVTVALPHYKMSLYFAGLTTVHEIDIVNWKMVQFSV